MSQLDSLYQDIILDHYKHPQGAGLREPYAAEVHHVNPTCGDEITLRLSLGVDGTVLDLSYDAEGCSISQAGASVAHEQLVGEPVDRAREALNGFRALMQSKGRPETEPDEDLLGDGVAFVGVSKFPGRVKCALLAWMAFEDALNQSTIDESSSPIRDNP